MATIFRGFVTGFTKAQHEGLSKFPMDLAHLVMKKNGGHLSLLIPLLDYDSYADNTKYSFRIAETKEFLLLGVTLNTQQQRRRGWTTHKIVH